jgi:hypothetical protein
VPLPDAGALKDPLVARLDHLFEIFIREKAGRHERRETADY